jgi:hypothetical protein
VSGWRCKVGFKGPRLCKVRFKGISLCKVDFKGIKSRFKYILRVYVCLK